MTTRSKPTVKRIVPQKPDYQSGSMPPTSTPWGRAQHKTQEAEGIWFVGTAGHGGLWVSDERLKEMPDHLKTKSRRSKNWFEEDCDYLLVVAAFPEVFPKIEEKYMKRSLKEYNWKAYEAHYGEVIPKGESYTKDKFLKTVTDERPYLPNKS